MAEPMLEKKTENETEPLSILVAEDNEVTQELVALLLNRRGHMVDVVSDGQAALDALQNKVYDVALVDLHMPKLDGLEVVTKTKREPSQPYKLPCFIGMTADIEGLLAHPANCENFDHVFAKPFDPVEICSAVENALKRQQQYPFKMLANRLSKSLSTPRITAQSDEAAGLSADGLQVVSNKTDRRRTKRLPSDFDGTTMQLDDGSVWECRITDISAAGMAVKVEFKPPIGVNIHIGRNLARVVRHTDSGIAVEFAEL